MEAAPEEFQVQKLPLKLVKNSGGDPTADYEVDAKDLEMLEQRIEEIERYLGIEDLDLAYFQSEDGEDLNKKS